MTRTFIAAAAVVVSALIASSPAAADSQGLVGYWKLDEGQGSFAADSSGFGNNGTVEGNAAWVQGLSGFALSFDGSRRGRVVVPDSSSLEPSSAVTVSAWVKSSGSPGTYRYIVAKGVTGCIASSYGLYTGFSGGLEFYVSSGHGTVYADSPDAGAKVWDGRWHFVVGTYDGTTVRLYVDGTQVGGGTAWGRPLEYTLSDSNELFIGDVPGCSNENFGFRGTVEDVSVWDRVLSPAEITADAAGPQLTVPPPSSPPPSTSGGMPQTSPSALPAPQLTFLNLVPAMFRLRPNSKLSGTTISYVASEPGVANLTVLQALPGIVRRRRCVRRFAVRSGGHPRSCTRFVTVGGFSHVDRAGRNRFHFTALPGRRLISGRYRLTVTPRSHGESGQTVVATFWVLW